MMQIEVLGAGKTARRASCMVLRELRTTERHEDDPETLEDPN
jgi:hypothetical protein